MSRNIKHYQGIDELVTNALLFLYCEKSQQGGYWTIKKRNELLVKFLKPKIKISRFSSCKNEIKTMLSIGRKPNGNLEHRLWELNKVNLDYRSQLTEADELYILLTDLFEQHQFPSLIENSDNEREDEVIYMKEKCVEKGFDDENNQIKPLAMTVKTTRLKVLIEAVQGKGIFRLEVGCVDEQQIIQLWLHRQS
ncbi:DUF2913 family protein [Vibrio splendidus]